jgi:hypothetical protein
MDMTDLEDVAHRYKKATDALDTVRTEMQATAVALLQQDGVKQADVARVTGWSREHLRRLKEKAELEALRRKVDELSAMDKPQPAVATPRVQVSVVVPPEPSTETEPHVEALATVSLPEMSPREIHKAIKRAMSRAKPDQRERLNLTAKTAEQLGRDRDGTVLKTALEMGLLKHDEVYAEPERPVSSEETSG